jgi:hypothetical protein
MSTSLTKEQRVRLAATLVGLPVPEICRKTSRHPSVFYRWLAGERTSGPLDKRVAAILGSAIVKGDWA